MLVGKLFMVRLACQYLRTYCFCRFLRFNVRHGQCSNSAHLVITNRNYILKLCSTHSDSRQLTASPLVCISRHNNEPYLNHMVAMLWLEVT